VDVHQGSVLSPLVFTTAIEAPSKTELTKKTLVL
jgi:hypothetical protein